MTCRSLKKLLHPLCGPSLQPSCLRCYTTFQVRIVFTTWAATLNDQCHRRRLCSAVCQHENNIAPPRDLQPVLATSGFTHLKIFYFFPPNRKKLFFFFLPSFVVTPCGCSLTDFRWRQFQICFRAGVSRSNDPPDGILLDLMSCKERPAGHVIAFGPLEGHPRGVFSGTGASRRPQPNGICANATTPAVLVVSHQEAGLRPWGWSGFTRSSFTNSRCVF